MNLILIGKKLSVYSILFLLIGIVNLQASSPTIAVDKVIEKEFDISNDGTLDIVNRHGNITVTENTSGKVKMKITIDVKTSSKSKADDVFDRINIDFSNSASYVSAKTEIEDRSGWTSWFTWGRGTDFNINYEISMPLSVHLKMVHRYGDIYIADLNNGLDLEMKYGNVVMGSVEGDFDLQLGYSKIDFGDVGNFNADVKYSSVKGSSTQKFKLTSKYSQFRIGDVAEMRSDTKYDEYEIDRVGTVRNSGKYDTWNIGEITNFNSNTKYSPIEIEKLTGELRINQKYGNILIDEVICNTEDIDLTVEYTEVELGMRDCGIDISYDGRYTDLRLPSELRDQVRKSKKETSLKGKFGNAERRLRLSMDYGELRIR